jgi:hypothetical protein
MATGQKNISIGTADNAEDGITLREAFRRIRKNFAEIYGDTDSENLTDTEAVTETNFETHIVEKIQDTIGDMVSGNTETNITVTYDDTNGNLDFVVAADITDVNAGSGLTGTNESGGAATLNVGAGTGITVNTDDIQIADGGVGSTQLAPNAVTNAKINNGAVNMDKLSTTVVVTESEGIGSNDNDTSLPTSAAVKDYVDTEVSGVSDNDTLGALTATDGGFVVGDGTAFGVETGSTARDSIGLGTSGHIQFHCLGVGEAASTNSGQIDATTVYADNIGKDSNDYISWTDNTQLDFYVNGSNEMRLESDGDLHVDGDVIAASTTVASDEKLKDNITKYENALDTINAINGVSFDWKRNGKKSGGVIAQDVQKVLPELVKEVKDLDGDDTHLTVDYNAIIGVLVEAVKELSEQVNKK